jgi:hypothetical protein
MKSYLAAATAALLSAGALALTAGTANAYVACNTDGDCWHTSHRDHYPNVNVQWHPDSWYWNRDWDNDHDHHWHGYHDGHGYWRGGVWVPL